jgi:Mn2+/Fe2+ NRAMP family transporter
MALQRQIIFMLSLQVLQGVCKMRKDHLGKNTKSEHKIDCIIRILSAFLASVLAIVASLSLLLGQPFINGVILLVATVVLLSMALGYQQIELIWKGLKVRLKR